MSIWSTLSDDVKSVIATLKADEKALAAMIYNDLAAGEAAAKTVIVSALPEIVAQIKAYALECVKALESNPAFKNALGSWKFGVAAYQVLSAIETGMLPGLGATVKTLAAATIETAVQAAFAAMLTGV